MRPVWYQPNLIAFIPQPLPGNCDAHGAPGTAPTARGSTPVWGTTTTGVARGVIGVKLWAHSPLFQEKAACLRLFALLDARIVNRVTPCA